MSHVSEDFVVDTEAVVKYENVNVRRQQRNRSFVWQYFRKLSRSKAQCLLCMREFGIKYSNTSGLTRHLRTKHPEVMDTVENKNIRNDSTTSQENSVHTYLNADSARAKKLTDAIARMMILDMQPCTIVEDVGFRSFLNIVEPRYQIPSCSTFERNIIPRMYEDLRNDIRRKIHANMAEGELVFAFTTDGWTTRSIESYLSLTVHYISKDFKTCHFMLNLTRLTQSHTAEDLQTVLLESLRAWELNSNSNKLQKPLYFVTDNGRNIVEAIDSLENWKRIPCYAHCLQLAVGNALKESAEFTGLRKKCRELVEFFSRSPSSREKFLQIQSTNNPQEEPLQLIQDVDTRWNTMYDMFQRLITLREPLTVILCEEHMPKNLNDDEWKLVDAIVTVLEPIKEATEIMCGEKYPTLSQYLPVYIGLTNVIQPDKAETKKVIEISNYLCNALKAHFEPIVKNEIFVHAMLLDPRFKELLLPPGEERWKAINSLKEKIETMANNFVALDVDPFSDLPSTSTTHQYDEKPSKLIKFFNDSLGSMEAVPSFHFRINEEALIYFSEGTVPQNADVIEWWKCNCKRLPIFAETARQYLGIPATQVSSERLLSDVGEIVTATRTKLVSEKVEELCFLHANFK